MRGWNNFDVVLSSAYLTVSIVIYMRISKANNAWARWCAYIHFNTIAIGDAAAAASPLNRKIHRLVIVRNIVVLCMLRTHNRGCLFEYKFLWWKNVNDDIHYIL